MVLNKQFSTNIEQLTIDIKANNANSIVAHFHFENRKLQWQHTFDVPKAI